MGATAVLLVMAAIVGAIWYRSRPWLRHLTLGEPAQLVFLVVWTSPFIQAAIAPGIWYGPLLTLAAGASAVWVYVVAGRIGATSRRVRLYAAYEELVRTFPREPRHADPAPVSRLLDRLEPLRDGQTQELIDILRELYHPDAGALTEQQFSERLSRLRVLVGRLRAGAPMEDPGGPR